LRPLIEPWPASAHLEPHKQPAIQSIEIRREVFRGRGKNFEEGTVGYPGWHAKKLGLKPGDSVKLFDYDGAIHVIPAAKNSVKEATGILPRRPSLSRKLLKDRTTE